MFVATGAIALWVTDDVPWIDLQLAGIVLLLAGAAVLVLSLVFWSSWGGPAFFGRRRA